MNPFKTLLLGAAVLLALACGGGRALAAPLYHVSIDTSALAGQGGYLDFLFLGLDKAAPARAKVFGLTGQFSGPAFGVGEAAISPSRIVLGNGGGWNEAGLWAQFGGQFSFALDFELAAAPDMGTTFAVALLDANFSYLGSTGDILQIALQPGQSHAVVADPAFASVVIPEAPSPWLMGAGLGLLAARAARGRRRYTGLLLHPPSLHPSS